jgi:DmsE family decaheme c-type cytochrome
MNSLRLIKTLVIGSFLAGALLLASANTFSKATGSVAATGPAEWEADQGAQTVSAKHKPEDFVGSETCKACHEGQFNSFAKTVHGKLGQAGGRAEKQGCESCHGPGKAHVEAGGDKSRIKNPANVSPAAASQTCMQCHSQVKAHASWRGSKHESAGLSCLSCHSAHHSQPLTADGKFAASFREPAAETKLLKGKSVTDTCFQCHSEVRKAQYQRSTHLFRNEDREHTQNCSSCHEPHGSLGPKMMRTATVNETCYQCHDEKRGPFLWEHAPAREDCGTCHKAHGSNNPALLQARANVLCQQCHIQGRHQTVPGMPKSTWAFNRACTQCHPAVHGSNHPSGVNLQR